MLSLCHYLLGVAYLAALATFATLGCGQIRKRLLPGWSGPPAWLATAVIALALLVWVAELLGTVGLFKPLPYLLGMGIVGLGTRALVPSPKPSSAVPLLPIREQRNSGATVAVVLGLLVAAAVTIHFAAGVRLRLSTGMTGFDSTWYHGPFAAGFFHGGDTWDLHFIAPQFLAWFYPANSEVFHAIGMTAFDRDIVSPLLNLGWFVGCLVACWCIGRPFGVAPFSLALGAIALNVPALADQAGEARNDIVGLFFLLAAVAVALNAGERAQRGCGSHMQVGAASALGPWVVAGLSAGMAAGTKLNFLLPAAVLVAGLVVIAPVGQRWRTLATAGLPALAGGGYWYLRNLAHTGNPLPWIDSLGPISLPAPDQALGGRDAHGVLSYLTDTSVWSDWFLPGLHEGLGIIWPLLLAAALAGLLCSFRFAFSLNNGEKAKGKLDSGVLGVAGATGLAVVVAWLIAPTSASGPEGMPRGFESGLRYLAPALVLGLALLPTAPPLRKRLVGLPVSSWLLADSGKKLELSDRWGRRGVVLGLVGGLVALVVAIGYPVQRHYLDSRYANPTFTTPGLNAAFKWSRSISDARIATTSTRQYPLLGTDLSNEVYYVGIEEPHGGFTAPTTCRTWRRLINEGDYDYVVASYDRTATGKAAYPPTAAWTSDPHATLVLSEPPTKVFKLKAHLDLSACR